MDVETFQYDCNPIIVESEAWLAAGSFVGPGVTIGRAAVLAARASAFKSLAPENVYAGTPARMLRPRILDRA